MVVGSSGVGSPTPDYSRAKLESAVHAEAIRHALYEVTSDDQASTSQQSESGWISSEDDGYGGFGEYLERCDEGMCCTININPSGILLMWYGYFDLYYLLVRR